MSEYIDIDDQIVVTDTRGRENKTTVRHIFEMNKGVYTAADVVERKTGVWLMDKMTRTCSVCGQMKATSHKDNFCPNCGADMRGEDDV